MKAIDVLKLISKEIDLVYEHTDDFANWTPQRSNLEVSIDNRLVVIEYSIDGVNNIQSEMSTMIKRCGKWIEIETGKSLKSFCENSFGELMRLRFEELLEKEEDERSDKELQMQIDEDMCNTYSSLQFFR